MKHEMKLNNGPYERQKNESVPAHDYPIILPSHIFSPTYAYHILPAHNQ